MSDPNCVFCKRIHDGDYSDTDTPRVVTFEPLNPVVPGHRLFVPIIHTKDAAEWPYLTGLVFSAAAQHALEEDRDYNLITSGGAAATQTIRHLHVHYVPRREGDGLHLPWTDQKPSQHGTRWQQQAWDFNQKEGQK